MSALAWEIATKGIPALRKDREATDGDLAYFQGLTRLQSLYLQATKITDSGLTDLIKASPMTDLATGRI